MAFQFQRRTKSKTKVCQQSLLETIRLEPAVPKGDFEITFGLNASFVVVQPQTIKRERLTGPYMEVKNKEMTTDRSYKKILIEFWRLLDGKQAPPNSPYFAGERPENRAWYNDDIILTNLQFCRKLLALKSTILVESSQLEWFDTWDGKGLKLNVEVVDDDVVDLSGYDTEVEIYGGPTNGTKLWTSEQLKTNFVRIFNKAEKRNTNKTEHVLVPYNMNNNHWILLHFHVAKNEICCDVYDSMYLRQIKIDRVQLLAEAMVKSVWSDRFKKMNPTVLIDFVQYKVPQTDSESCGVYACLAGAMLMSGMPKAEIMQINTDIQFIRKCRVFFFKLLASQPWSPELAHYPYSPLDDPPLEPNRLSLGGTRKKSKARRYASTHRKRSVLR